MSSKSRALVWSGPKQGKLRNVDISLLTGKTLSDITLYNDNNLALAPLNGIQITESENHPLWKNRKHSSFTGDIGGNFTMTRKEVLPGNRGPFGLSGAVDDLQNHHSYFSNYEGPILPCASNFIVFPPAQAISESNLNKLGTEAIARCSPSNPHADVTTFMTETMSEGIPHDFTQTLKALRGMSDQKRHQAISDAYLNYEFGWKPFIGDLKKASKAILDAEKVLSQYIKDSGKPVRRGWNFPVVNQENEITYLTGRSPWYSPSGGYISDNLLINQGKIMRKETFYQKTWFRGAFSYYVPSGTSNSDRRARQVILARQLLGVSLSPDAVWNSLPWSWAVDWISDTGDILRNVSNWAIDNQVLLYGYIMQHTLQTYTYTFVGETGFRAKSLKVAPVTTVTETKVRRRATPYGFGLNVSGFTNRQKAIIAALGINRVK